MLLSHIAAFFAGFFAGFCALALIVANSRAIANMKDEEVKRFLKEQAERRDEHL